MTNRLLATVFGALAILVAAPPADAAIVTHTSPGAVQPSENVLFQNMGPANPLVTTTNHNTSVTFTGNEMLNSVSGGQARISGADGNLNSLTFYLTNPAFGMSAVEFLLTDPNGQHHTSATIDFYDQNNAVTSIANFVLGNGNDWFSAETNGGSTISKVVITTLANISDVRQVRITAAAVPEPAVWAMLIGGFGMIGAASRRRRHAAALAS